MASSFFRGFFKTLSRRHGGATGALFRAHGPHRCPPEASQLGLLAVLVWLVVRYLFDHRLPRALPPPDCRRYGKKKATPDELEARAEANG
jgi:hypothetical protein